VDDLGVEAGGAREAGQLEAQRFRAGRTGRGDDERRLAPERWRRRQHRRLSGDRADVHETDRLRLPPLGPARLPRERVAVRAGRLALAPVEDHVEGRVGGQALAKPLEQLALIPRDDDQPAGGILGGDGDDPGLAYRSARGKSSSRGHMAASPTPAWAVHSGR
jgi:hypothetical protein